MQAGLDAEQDQRERLSPDRCPAADTYHAIHHFTGPRVAETAAPFPLKKPTNVFGAYAFRMANIRRCYLLPRHANQAAGDVSQCLPFK